MLVTQDPSRPNVSATKRKMRDANFSAYGQRWGLTLRKRLKRRTLLLTSGEPA